MLCACFVKGAGSCHRQGLEVEGGALWMVLGRVERRPEAVLCKEHVHGGWRVALDSTERLCRRVRDAVSHPAVSTVLGLHVCFEAPHPPASITLPCLSGLLFSVVTRQGSSDAAAGGGLLVVPQHVRAGACTCTARAASRLPAAPLCCSGALLVLQPAQIRSWGLGAWG